MTRRTVLLCCLAMLAAWLPLGAQQRDVRLVDAVKRRDQKLFAALLRARADVNAAQADGATPLAWAVHLGERGMADALLDAGADPNAADEYGGSPATPAAGHGDPAPPARRCRLGRDRDAGGCDRGSAAPG